MKCLQSSLFRMNLPLLLLVLAGCQTMYDRYTYKPHPAASELTVTEGDASRNVSVLISVLGIREREPMGTIIETRVRVDNDSRQTARFFADNLALFGADLSRFPLIQSSPAGVQTVAPGSAVTVDASFEFPEGVAVDSTDLAGLSLRWVVEVGPHRFTRTTSFERKKRDEYENERIYHYYPYYYHHGRFPPRVW